ncbi:hypothetical protein Trydic_g12180 [Trypoxylus dichotomus]
MSHDPSVPHNWIFAHHVVCAGGAGPPLQPHRRNMVTLLPLTSSLSLRFPFRCGIKRKTKYHEEFPATLMDRTG